MYVQQRMMARAPEWEYGQYTFKDIVEDSTSLLYALRRSYSTASCVSSHWSAEPQILAVALQMSAAHADTPFAPCVSCAVQCGLR